MRTAAAVGACVVTACLAGCGTTVATSHRTADQPSSMQSSNSADPAPTTLPDSTSTSSALPNSASTSSAACPTALPTSGPDLLVRYVYADTGEVDVLTLGPVNYVTCSPTVPSLQKSETEADECVTIATVDSNPGYDTQADKPAPLKHVIATAGPGC